MKNFFTISEFAKLRDLNINSLRYYEKLGLLKPAYIDKDTNYRYYTAEQLSVLDKIILCIQIGIPLKEMVSYFDEDGNLQSQKLLEHGKIVAQKRMNELQNTLNFIDFSLKSIEDNKKYEHESSLYVRELEKRRIITTDYLFKPLTIKEVVKKVSLIYKKAQEDELFPILPAGQIFEISEDGSIRYRLFLQILNYEKEYPNTMVIPGGMYSCKQVNLTASVDIFDVIQNIHKDGEASTIIIDNIILDKYSYGTRLSEVQKFIPFLL